MPPGLARQTLFDRISAIYFSIGYGAGGLTHNWRGRGVTNTQMKNVTDTQSKNVTDTYKNVTDTQTKNVTDTYKNVTVTDTLTDK